MKAIFISAHYSFKTAVIHVLLITVREKRNKQLNLWDSRFSSISGQSDSLNGCRAVSKIYIYIKYVFRVIKRHKDRKGVE